MRAGEVDELGEDPGPDDEREEDGGGLGGVDEDADQLAHRHPPQQREEERARRPDTRRLRRGEEARVDAAEHHDEQERDRPRPRQRLQTPRAAGLRRLGCRIGAPRDGPAHGGRVADHADEAGHDAGGEERADVGFGRDAVDHHDDRGRDQDAQRAARRDRRRGEAVGVAELPHRRDRHPAHRDRRCDRRAADRREAAAGDDGRHAEAAAVVADEGLRGAEELLRDAGARDQVAHEDEERNYREVVAQRRADRREADHREGRCPAHDHRVSHGADDAERERDGYPHEDQH